MTEPRRISAISLAERVSRELGDKGVDAGGAGTDGSLVGYSIRLESKIGRNTVSTTDGAKVLHMSLISIALTSDWLS